MRREIDSCNGIQATVVRSTGETLVTLMFDDEVSKYSETWAEAHGRDSTE